MSARAASRATPKVNASLKCWQKQSLFGPKLVVQPLTFSWLACLEVGDVQLIQSLLGNLMRVISSAPQQRHNGHGRTGDNIVEPLCWIVERRSRVYLLLTVWVLLCGHDETDRTRPRVDNGYLRHLDSRRGQQ
jgi:hypothetical protein